MDFNKIVSGLSSSGVLGLTQQGFAIETSDTATQSRAMILVQATFACRTASIFWNCKSAVPDN
jgi:hypothetical protein